MTATVSAKNKKHPFENITQTLFLWIFFVPTNELASSIYAVSPGEANEINSCNSGLDCLSVWPQVTLIYHTSTVGVKEAKHGHDLGEGDDVQGAKNGEIGHF